MNYTTPENSYAIMTSLFTEYKIKEMYTSKMPGLEMNFYILLSLQKKFMPALFRKLRDENYVPQIWASQWFLTFFAAYFPVEITSRIWDIYLVEGRKTIFRFALAILKINEAALLKADLEGLFTILKDYG